MSNAHITIDGRPLCEFSALAYRERLTAAGRPCCSDSEATQLLAAPRVAKQFPGRVALVFKDCPISALTAKGNTSEAAKLILIRDEVRTAKIADAQQRCSSWLADGNAAQERGHEARAERCYAKSQFWLDRLNKLEGKS